MDAFDPFSSDDNPPPPGGLLAPSVMGGAPGIMSSSPSPLLAPSLNPPSPETSSEMPLPMETQTAPDSDIAVVQSGFTSTSPNIQWPSTQGSANYSGMGDLFSTQHSDQSLDVTSPGESILAQDGPTTISTPVYNYETASFEEPPQKPIRNFNPAEENFANFDEALAPADVIPSNFAAGLVDNNKVGKLNLWSWIPVIHSCKMKLHNSSNLGLTHRWLLKRQLCSH